MVKNPSKSILFQKCLKKIMLIFGFSCFLVIQGTVSLLAGSGLNVGFSDNLQQITIRGLVVDANNNPMTGVNVVEKGTTNGVLTGADGTYSITVTATSAILTFTFIGYESTEVTVGNQTTVNVTLTESVIGLEEVVVVGYGTQRKEAVTGSVLSIPGDILREIPSTN